ncbi:MAG: prepilin-type N-terminal cleavage/methylation domain-containing protein [Gammaproteobacteria bacterium]
MNPRQPAADRISGFTLVELVIVIAITGVVAVLASTLVGAADGRLC